MLRRRGRKVSQSGLLQKALAPQSIAAPQQNPMLPQQLKQPAQTSRSLRQAPPPQQDMQPPMDQQAAANARSQLVAMKSAAPQTPQQVMPQYKAVAQKQPSAQEKAAAASMMPAQPPQKKISNELVLDTMKNTKQPAAPQPMMAKGGMVRNKGVGASMKPHNVFGKKK